MRLCKSRNEQPQKAKRRERSNCLKAALHSLLFSVVVISFLSLGTVSALAAATPDGKPEFPAISLSVVEQGEQAIQKLGDKLSEVAEWYGMTEQQFVDMLREDHTARIDTEGRLFYVDEAPDPAIEDAETDIATAPFAYDQTFKLHSRSGSKRVLYLDFNGHLITGGTAWNNSYGDPINAKPYDLDSDPSTFSNEEMDRIQNIWLLVAEDYAPFDIDVTTEDPGQDAITRSSASDEFYGTRMVMTDDDFAGCGCGGFAYVGVFDNVGNHHKPAFVFNKSLIGAAEAASHEAGHNLGLSHDGITGGSGYYSGHGSGNTGWAPIMGAGYNKNLVQWSQGEYPNSNQTQDDIQIIQDNGALLLADDHGNNAGTATALGITANGSSITLDGKGIIERRTDLDFFSFTSGAGTISINVTPAAGVRIPNLDILATLYNASGTLITSSNPVDDLNASINVDSLPAGVYFISIDGTGNGSLATGYSDYASLGKYTISGSAPSPGGGGCAEQPIISPTPGTMITTDEVTFTGSHGSGDLQHWIYVGTEGVGSYNLLNKDLGTEHSATASGWSEGDTVLYVRFWTKCSDGWKKTDQEFPIGEDCEGWPIISPTPGATITTNEATFTGGHGSGDLQHWIYVGTEGVGSYNLLNKDLGTGHTATASGWSEGDTVLYVRFWTKCKDGWEKSDQEYLIDSGVACGFDSQFNGSAAGWVRLAAVAPWVLKSNAFYYTAGKKNEWTSTYFGSSYSTDTMYSDFDFKAKLWRNGSDTNSTGIMFRGNQIPSGSGYRWDRGYGFYYMRDGRYSIWKYTNGVASAVVNWKSHNAINQGSAWNSLMVTASGTSVRFYINGTFIGTMINASYTNGKAGITMYSNGQSGTGCWADWAVLTCSNTASAERFADDGNGMIFDESQVMQAYESNDADTGSGITLQKESLNSSGNNTFIDGDTTLRDDSFDSSDKEITEDQ
ncbi:MAG: hypothetical protein D8M57_11705 [Candidatus Scalindua sp. AMX11]|nr:MAG: hypothetical protein DWQ00_18015 [Candidatus Scalindua sp.]NOG85701.1 hypothetical protein [Planctomycetota bacterium]RZV73152.1 MAG: hypothetical protein EX341_13505 [Candidatus Scalindua sp. SCAELEC01]TDE64760.1 MAG: hypothetical protein D8M57_11705 [Candidatus Scalindua sp. AMX11]GJQ58675.1 MAG: hypothetical protein SCALA701_14760 [Candidatus Scalindua sp.]